MLPLINDVYPKFLCYVGQSLCFYLIYKTGLKYALNITLYRDSSLYTKKKENRMKMSANCQKFINRVLPFMFKFQETCVLIFQNTQQTPLMPPSIFICIAFPILPVSSINQSDYRRNFSRLSA